MFIEMKYTKLLLTFYMAFWQFQTTLTDSSESPCSDLRLLYGKVRLRSKGRVARFKCDPSFQLLGSKISTCIRGLWEPTPPLCIRNDCSRITKSPENGYWIEMYRGASYTLVCNAGFHINGTQTIYCYKKEWSNSIPSCEATNKESATSCDFERENLCGWTHDIHHNFNWSRQNYATPSGHVGTGPSFDHTLGQGQDGHYMYIESSSPRLENDTARLFSPTYLPHLSHNACFTFWYHMYGATTVLESIGLDVVDNFGPPILCVSFKFIQCLASKYSNTILNNEVHRYFFGCGAIIQKQGTLNVYRKLQSGNITQVFQISGEQGNMWFMGFISLTPVDQPFQIIIEAIRGRSYVSDIAIDDVKLTSGDECAHVTTELLQVTPKMTSPPTAELGAGLAISIRPYPTHLPPPPPPPLPPLPPILTLMTPKLPYLYTPRVLGTQEQTTLIAPLIQQTNTSIQSMHVSQMTASFPPSDSSSSLYFDISVSSHAKREQKTTVPMEPNINLYSGKQSTPEIKHYVTLHSSMHHYIIKGNSSITSSPLSSASAAVLSSAPDQAESPSPPSPSPSSEQENLSSVHFKKSIHSKEDNSLTTKQHTSLSTQKPIVTAVFKTIGRQHRTTIQPSTVIKAESKNAQESLPWQRIAGISTGVGMAALIAGVVIFIVAKRRMATKKQNAMSEDSDVRFLTSDEVLDFNLARPMDDV